MRQGGRCVRRQAARPCALPHRRVRQHRADPQAGKAHGHHPQPRDLRLPCFAGTEPAQGTLQGQLRHHHRQLRQLRVPRRQGADHIKGAVRRAGQGNHRHLQHGRIPRARGFPQPELSEARQGADESG